MTRLAAPLQDRRNILRESDVAWRRPRLPPNGGWCEETRKNRNEPHEAKHRGASSQRTSDVHSHTSLNHRVFHRNVTLKEQSIQAFSVIGRILESPTSSPRNLCKKYCPSFNIL